MSRVPRGTLSRERIVDAALELVDAGGTEALSMPKLARHLGVGVMSLYTHIEGRDDLLDAVVQRVLESLPAPAGDDWRQRIRSHFHDLRAAFVDHPGLGAVFATKNVATAAVLDLLEENLGTLTAAGIDDEDAVRLYYAMLTYTLGFVAWELPRRDTSEGDYADRWRAALETTAAATHPTLRRLVDSLATAASDAQYDDGLDRLIASADRSSS